MLQTKNILTYDKRHMSNPCGKYVTDNDFLKHMIPHHQVAVDMSKRIMKNTINPNIIYLARNIIYKQSDEILFMENVLLSNIPTLASKDKDTFIKIPTQFSFYYPKASRAKNPQCGLHHYDPSLIKSHDKHTDGEGMTDEEFMKHMIPHHDVAIEMAERVIKNSKKPIITNFAYGVISNQRYEIWLMKNYLKKGYKNYVRRFEETIPFNFSDKNRPKNVFYNGIEGFSKHNYKFKIILFIICILLLIFYRNSKC
jgi:uncharacterized protein (DUF305 family)